MESTYLSQATPGWNITPTCSHSTSISRLPESPKKKTYIFNPLLITSCKMIRFSRLSRKPSAFFFFESWQQGSNDAAAAAAGGITELLFVASQGAWFPGLPGLVHTQKSRGSNMCIEFNVNVNLVFLEFFYHLYFIFIGLYHHLHCRGLWWCMKTHLLPYWLFAATKAEKL